MISINKSKAVAVIMAIALAEIACFFLGYSIGAQEPSRYYIDMGTREITSYKAIRAECDDTPDIGAGGRVAKNGVPLGSYFACNWLPFGTKIVIPEISGKKIWTCRDRMNKRLPHRVDLLLHKSAKGIGLRRAKIYLVYYPDPRSGKNLIEGTK